MSFLLILLISVILFLIFSEPVSIRLTRSYDTVIDINFFFTGVILYPERNKPKKKSKKRLLKRLKNKILLFLASGKSLAFLLNNSSVSLREFNIGTKTPDPSKSILIKKGADALLSALLLFFRNKYGNILIETSTADEEKIYPPPSIDIYALTNLFFVFCSFFVFIFEIISKKIKRGIKLVGNKNE